MRLDQGEHSLHWGITVKMGPHFPQAEGKYNVCFQISCIPREILDSTLILECNCRLRLSGWLQAFAIGRHSRFAWIRFYFYLWNAAAITLLRGIRMLHVNKVAHIPFRNLQLPRDEERHIQIDVGRAYKIHVSLRTVRVHRRKHTVRASRKSISSETTPWCTK